MHACVHASMRPYYAHAPVPDNQIIRYIHGMEHETSTEVWPREWDGKYGPTYLVLDLLQKVFYTSDAARESFVELCEEEYVQKVTFDAWTELQKAIGVL